MVVSKYTVYVHDNYIVHVDCNSDRLNLQERNADGWQIYFMVIYRIFYEESDSFTLCSPILKLWAITIDNHVIC